MGPLTIQIMILIASFLFYRILKTGFDSWKALLIDFAIIAFLFGLQYYLQTKQQKTENNVNNEFAIDMFPTSILSTFLNTKFPTKIATNNISVRPEHGSFLQLSNDTYVESGKKEILHFTNKLENQLWKDNKFHISKEGFYIVQMTCDTDIVPYSSKLTIHGQKNHIDKIIHDGENSFIVYLRSNDHIHFEIENDKHNIMMNDTTTLYIVKL